MKTKQTTELEKQRACDRQVERDSYNRKHPVGWAQTEQRDTATRRLETKQTEIGKWLRSEEIQPIQTEQSDILDKYTLGPDCDSGCLDQGIRVCEHEQRDTAPNPWADEAEVRAKVKAERDTAKKKNYGLFVEGKQLGHKGSDPLPEEKNN
jgi:hypothetical protein